MQAIIIKKYNLDYFEGIQKDISFKRIKKVTLTKETI
jgi:hypothetical protein